MRIYALLAMIMAALCVCAQEWGTHWISHPSAGDTDQVWFRRTFLSEGMPASAQIAVASGGNFVVYVNGYNVSGDVLVPYGDGPADTIRMMRYEVTRFLNPDTNVVAVWYSPESRTRRQLSLTVYGYGRARQLFAYHTDGTWMCRTANARTLPCGDEIINDNDYVDSWNLSGCGITGWLPAEVYTGKEPVPLAETPPVHPAERISRIYRYRFLDDYGRDIIYHFGHSFKGWVRVTLRGMSRGDTVSVNGLRYVCSGRADEQACRMFTVSESGTALVSGPPGFSRGNVADIEGIRIERYEHESYLY